MSQTRNIGIDLLRLVLMALIILGHLFAHTQVRTAFPILSLPGAWCWGWQTICLCAVDCFVLITGYFMFRAQWKLSHLLKLWLNIWVYAVGIGCAFTLAGKTSLTPFTLLDMFLPVLRRVWWFMSMYVLLYLFIPFLNQGLRQLTRQQFTYLAMGIVLVFYVSPLFAFFFPPYDPTEGMGIIGFVTLYILGAYLAAQNLSLSWKKCLTGLLINNVCIFASKVLLQHITEIYHLSVGTGLLYHYNTIFELFNAILLLLLFKQIPWTHGAKWIVGSASSVFAVYLLHEHPLVREGLWQNGLSPFLQQLSFTQFALLTCALPLAVLGAGIVIDKLFHYVLLDPIFRSKLWKNLVTQSKRADELLSPAEDVCQTR